jgi:hypothetical protein
MQKALDVGKKHRGLSTTERISAMRWRHYQVFHKGLVWDPSAMCRSGTDAGALFGEVPSRASLRQIVVHPCRNFIL